MPAFRADGVGSGSVTVGDGGGVIGGDGSGPVVVITNVSMVADFGSTGGDAGGEGKFTISILTFLNMKNTYVNL